MNSKLKNKQNQIRVLGQRRIDSSLRLGSPIQNAIKDPGKSDRRKNDLISLSEFLNKKIHSSPSLPGKTAVKGKSRPFCSPFGSKADAETEREVKEEEVKEEECKKIIDEVVFEQFKCSGVEIEDQKGSADEDQRGSSATLFGTRVIRVGETATSSNHKDNKRWNPNDGDDHKNTTQKKALVLGGNPALKRKGREESSKKLASNKRTRPRYNHYANGSGWWDSDMEGIDTEEVGFGEVWEGLGSMTFGGIDWH